MAASLRHRLFGLRELVDDLAFRAPARLAVTVFACVVVLFAVLLMVPFATADGEGAHLVDALFTAVSAVCVTGLVVQDTATYWSLYGQIVILAGIKVGGFGIMTVASLLGMIVSRKIGLTQKLLTASETKTSRLGDVGSLIRVIIVTATTLELSIALLIFPRLVAIEENVGTAAWHALFYGISAFNNAGFVPTTEGLMPHVGDWALVLPIALGRVHRGPRFSRDPQPPARAAPAGPALAPLDQAALPPQQAHARDERCAARRRRAAAAGAGVDQPGDVRAAELRGQAAGRALRGHHASLGRVQHGRRRGHARVELAHPGRPDVRGRRVGVDRRRYQGDDARRHAARDRRRGAR